MRRPDRCIYCGRTDNLCRRAHILPACMGAFENQPTLKNRVCKDCDTEIGKCEGQLITCGMEALLRIKLGITGRSGKDSSSLFRRKHYGHGPIRLTIEFPYVGWQVLVEPTEDGQNCRLLPQLVLIAQDGTCYQILLEDASSIDASELSKRIADAKGKNWKKAWAVNLEDKETDYVFGLLSELGLAGSEEILEHIQPFETIVCARGVITYGRWYFRAIAKIAFHYFLLHSRIFDGSEEEFKTLRRFIRYDEGDETSFIIRRNDAIAWDPCGADRPPYYGHVLRTDISLDTIAVGVQLFIGRDYKPAWHMVILSRKHRQVFLQTEEFGHYYKYLEPEERTQYDGVIEKLAVAQIVRPPWARGDQR